MGNINSKDDNTFINSAFCQNQIDDFFSPVKVHPENDIIEEDTLYENITYMRQWHESLRKRYQAYKENRVA